MFLFTIISALLSLYVFPPHSWTWLSFVFLVPLLFDLDTIETPKEAFIKMTLFGAVMMGHFHSWILDISPWASTAGATTMWIALSLYLGAFYGLMGWFYVVLRRTNFSVLVLPVLWTLSEWLREIAPFSSPGGTLGYTQFSSILLKISPYFGVLGVSFICVLVNVLLFTFISELRSKSAFRVWGYAVTVFLLLFVLKAQSQAPAPTTEPLSVAIVQGNHSQETKLNPRQWSGIIDTYFNLSEPYWQHNIILWPENLIPRVLRNDRHFMSRVQEKLVSPNQTLVLGATQKDQDSYYNGITLITNTGQTPQTYQKERLMPFGEYIPYRSFFSLFGPKEILSKYVGFTHGQNQTLLSASDHYFGSAICLESCYVNPFQQQTLAGASFLSVVVNTAWFEQDKASEQHLHFSIFRAAENQRYLIQASNIGHSVIIAPDGSIDQEIPFRTQGSLSGLIYPQTQLSLYTQKPWLLPGVLVCFLMYFSYRAIRYGTGKNAELLF